MKNHQKEELRTRRDFLRQSACASLGVTGMVNVLANLRLITAASAQADAYLSPTNHSGRIRILRASD